MNVDIKKRIESVICVFETNSIVPKYDTLTILPDGKNKSRQITYGKMQTTEQGNLDLLILKYVENKGEFSNLLQPYLEKIKKVPLVDDLNFVKILKMAAEDVIMQKTQDDIFDELYFGPAENWCKYNGFNMNLSHLVVFDSCIHSGGIKETLRNSFSEKPPVSGGDEKRWINAYVNSRRNWLATHSNAVLHSTVYRMDCFLDSIKRDNWDMSKTVNIWKYKI